MTDWADPAYESYLPSGTILSQMSAALVVTDPLGNLLYANPYATRLFGFPAGREAARPAGADPRVHRPRRPEGG